MLRDWREELAECEDDRERLAYAVDLLSEILDGSYYLGAYKALWGLSPMESRFLHRLARTPGHVVPHEALQAMMHEDADLETARVHILRIRRKVGVRIASVHGVGYVLQTKVPFTEEEIRAALAEKFDAMQGDWSAIEDDRLLALREEGVSWRDTSLQLRRTLEACKSRYKKITQGGLA